VDVARLAGVSQKTVSRVLNDEPYVSADVRRRVLDAAEELGYRRNQAARALASGRTRSIGVVTLGTALYGPASLLMAIERAVREVGYTLRVADTIEGDPGGIAGALASLLDQGVDGVVISEPIDEGVGLISVDVPVLVLGAPSTFAAPQVVTARVGSTLDQMCLRRIHHCVAPISSAASTYCCWRSPIVTARVTRK
jgi:DNA-binding LacI/PurR family transcriptional regulator